MSVCRVDDLPYIFEDTLAQAFRDISLLSDYELEFLEDMQCSYDRYGEAMIVTDAQMIRLDRIREKVY